MAVIQHKNCSDPDSEPTYVMRLRALFKQLDHNEDLNPLVSSFEQAGIKTVPDFLYALPPRELHERLAPGTLSFANFLSLQRQATQLNASTALNGSEIFEEQANKRTRMSGGTLGVDRLDSLLGGFGTFHLVDIAGGHGSGKTARL
jgi:hypothetical protein